jgi:hypothetical protein
MPRASRVGAVRSEVACRSDALAMYAMMRVGADERMDAQGLVLGDEEDKAVVRAGCTSE